MLPVSGPVVEDAAVAVEGDSIVAAGRFDDVSREVGGEVRDLGERVILPGLINAHCHLDYTMLRRAIDPPRSFTDWIRRINALKRSLGTEEYLAAIREGFAESKKWGGTTILNIESFPELLCELEPPPLRAWFFYEMIDIRRRLYTDEMMAGALAFIDGKPGWLGGFGLSPHSPYTASAELYRLATKCAAELGMPLTTHVAESAEEDWMFRDRAGALYEFLLSLDRDPGDCAGRSSFANLIESGALAEDAILVHMNELHEDDFALIEGRNLNIVHCPRSHEYFHHRPFAFERLAAAGVNLSLGTDSLASCESLSLFSEMQKLRETTPGLAPEDILKTVTVNPARALKLDGRLGCIGAGALADLISIPFSGNTSDVAEAVVTNSDPVDWVMVNGRELVSPA